jgi:chromosome segregation ATPase
MAASLETRIEYHSEELDDHEVRIRLLETNDTQLEQKIRDLQWKLVLAVVISTFASNSLLAVLTKIIP